MRLFKQCLMGLCLFIGLMSASASMAESIDKIIVFGDSLSDNGNLFAFTTKAHKVIPMVPIIPKNPPYFEGRFTNGFNWIDDLSTAFQVPVEDYAYGGSWAEPILDSKLNVPFGLDIQVDDYILRHPIDTHRDQHLFIIWSGANDYVHGRPDPDYATTNAVATIQKQIEWLIYYGAKHILILGVPDLSMVPEVRAEGAEDMNAVRNLSEMHNRKLMTMMKAEQAENPSLNLMAYDITDDFNDIFINPEKYNLKETFKACYEGGFYFGRGKYTAEIEAAKQVHLDLINNPSLNVAYRTGLASLTGEVPCDNPDDYLFWDTIHPTRVVHQLIANKAMTFLQSHGVDGGSQA